MHILLVFLIFTLLASTKAGSFLFFDDSSCANGGWTYSPVNYVLDVPAYWDGQCLNIQGTSEHFEFIYSRSARSSVHLQIWAPTFYCGFMLSNTATDTFDVQSDTSDITCRQGTFSSQNGTHGYTMNVWVTVVPGANTWPSSSSSSTGLPPVISSTLQSSSAIASSSSSTGSRSSSRGPRFSSSSTAPEASSSSVEPSSSTAPNVASSSVFSSSYTPVTSLTSEPDPFDSSMLNPTGQVIPDTAPTGLFSSSTGTPTPAPDDTDKSSNAMVIGVASGVSFVLLVLAAAGIYFLLKRRRQSQDQLPSIQSSNLRESLYTRDSRFSDDY